jgi:hypothetical protein
MPGATCAVRAAELEHQLLADAPRSGDASSSCPYPASARDSHVVHHRDRRPRKLQTIALGRRMARRCLRTAASDRAYGRIKRSTSAVKTSTGCSRNYWAVRSGALRSRRSMSEGPTRAGDPPSDATGACRHTTACQSAGSQCVAGRGERHVPRIGDLLAPHGGAHLPDNDVARAVAEHARPIQAPADDPEVVKSVCHISFGRTALV